MSGREFGIVNKKKERNMDSRDQITGDIKKYYFICSVLNGIFSLFCKHNCYFLN